MLCQHTRTIKDWATAQYQGKSKKFALEMVLARVGRASCGGCRRDPSEVRGAGGDAGGADSGFLPRLHSEIDGIRNTPFAHNLIGVKSWHAQCEGSKATRMPAGRQQREGGEGATSAGAFEFIHTASTGTMPSPPKPSRHWAVATKAFSTSAASAGAHQSSSTSFEICIPLPEQQPQKRTHRISATIPAQRGILKFCSCDLETTMKSPVSSKRVWSSKGSNPDAPRPTSKCNMHEVSR